MSQSELNALQTRLRKLWTVQVGTERPEDLIVNVHIQLKPDGRLAAPPEVVSRGTSLPYRKAADAALSAVQEAQPFDMLMATSYDAWKDMVVTFDPRPIVQQSAEEDEEKTRREMQAKIDEPKYVLTRSYYDYIQVKTCYENRKGYLEISISSAEMERAKAAVKVLETFSLGKDSNLDKDALWKLAGSDSREWMIEGDKWKLIMAGGIIVSANTSDRERCQVMLGALEDRAKRLVPSSAVIKKDF